MTATERLLLDRLKARIASCECLIHERSLCANCLCDHALVDSMESVPLLRTKLNSIFKVQS